MREADFRSELGMATIIDESHDSEGYILSPADGSILKPVPEVDQAKLDKGIGLAPVMRRFVRVS